MRQADLEELIDLIQRNESFEKHMPMREAMRVRATDRTWPEASGLKYDLAGRQLTVDYSPALDHDRAGLLRVRDGNTELFSHVIDPQSAQMNGSGAYLGVLWPNSNDKLMVYVR